MIIDRIREDMAVVAADDHYVGFVASLEDADTLRITFSPGYRQDHLIPLTWVSEVSKYVHLDKTSTYVTTNWWLVEGCRKGRQAPKQPVEGA